VRNEKKSWELRVESVKALLERRIFTELGASGEATSQTSEVGIQNREANPLAETFVRMSKVPFRNEAARGTAA
jgi:hypothetical protein